MADEAPKGRAAIVVGLCLAATAGVAAAPTLVVDVDDAGCGPTAIVDAAKLEVSRTYSSIGVSVVWAEKGENKSGSLEGDLALTVVLLSQVRTDTFLVRRRLSRTQLGVAPGGTRRVYIFCGRIARRAISTGEKRGRFLVGSSPTKWAISCFRQTATQPSGSCAHRWTTKPRSLCGSPTLRPLRSLLSWRRRSSTSRCGHQWLLRFREGGRSGRPPSDT